MVNRRGLTGGLVATVVIVVGGISWVIWRLWTNAGNIPPRVPWVSVAVLVVVAGIVLWFGRTVRTYQKGRARRPLNPMRAARTLALAQAAALTGAAVLGWYGGQAVVLLPDADLRAYQHLFLPLGAGAAGGLLLLVAGMVVQSWCRVEPPDDERDRGGNGEGRVGNGR
jgi:hypothetical protein